MPSSRPFLDGLKHIAEPKSAAREHEVERLTREMNDAMNNCDFSKPVLEHMAADYVIEDDHHFLGNPAWRSGSLSLAARLDEHKKFNDEHPDYRVEILEISTFFDDRKQTADVFMSCKTSGLPVGRNGEGVMVLRWVWRNGSWTCIKGIALRGSAGPSFC